MSYCLSDFQPFSLKPTHPPSLRSVAEGVGCIRFEKFLHLRLHRSIHLDEQWRGAFEAFAGQFLRRVNAEFAGGMWFYVERVASNAAGSLATEAIERVISLAQREEACVE